MTEPPIILTPDELLALTGCRRPSDQVRRLHAAGYWLATLTAAGCCLPRAHYLAVCAGAVRSTEPIPLTDQRRPRVRALVEA